MAAGLMCDTCGELTDKTTAFIAAVTVAGQSKAELVTDIADIAVAALSPSSVSTKITHWTLFSL